MDPSPRPLHERDHDAELGVPVPFACDSGRFGEPGSDRSSSIRRLDGRRVTQCALSRVCGVCGAGLGRPLALVGTRAEADRNAFHFPPCHLECARRLLDVVEPLEGPVLGQAGSVTDWVLTTTSAFEFVRPGRDDVDRRATFQPYEVLTTTS
jgi:hypothetical protein